MSSLFYERGGSQVNFEYDPDVGRRRERRDTTEVAPNTTEYRVLADGQTFFQAPSGILEAVIVTDNSFRYAPNHFVAVNPDEDVDQDILASLSIFDEDGGFVGESVLLYGGRGEDLLFGGYQDEDDDQFRQNTLVGGEGDDSLVGGQAADVLYGDWANGPNIVGNIEWDFPDEDLTVTGNDTLEGGDGDDTLLGGPGDDILIGGRGSDSLVGGDGSDVFFGGPRGDGDRDIYVGGDGKDYFFISNSVDPGETLIDAVPALVDFGEDQELSLSSVLADGLTSLTDDALDDTVATALVDAGLSLASELPGVGLAVDAIDFIFGLIDPGVDEDVIDEPLITDDRLLILDFDPREDVVFVPVPEGTGITVDESVYEATLEDGTVIDGTVVDISANLPGASSSQVIATIALSSDFIDSFTSPLTSAPSPLEVNEAARAILQQIFNTPVRYGSEGITDGDGVAADAALPFSANPNDYLDGDVPANAGSTALGFADAVATQEGVELAVYGAWGAYQFAGAASSTPKVVTGSNFGDLLYSETASAFNPADWNDPQVISLGSDQTQVNGYGGDDVIVGGNGGDTLTGGTGDDLIYGFASVDGAFDLLSGDEGDDTFFIGIQTALVTQGAAIIKGGEEDEDDFGDTLSFELSEVAVEVDLTNLDEDGFGLGRFISDFDVFGDPFSSIQIEEVENLVGTAGEDTLIGDGNVNIIEGGAGADTLGVGPGDILSYASSEEEVSITGTSINADGTTDDISGGDSDGDVLTGVDSLLDLGGFILSEADDQLFLANIGFTDEDKGYFLDGGRGDDNLKGAGGADTLFGGSGDDTLVGIGDDLTIVETMHGGTGNDAIFSGTVTGLISGDAGDDTLNGNDGDDTFTGGAGDDSIAGGEGSDQLRFESSGLQRGVTLDVANGTATDIFGGTDTFSSIESFFLTDGADTATGSSAGELISGGSGDDTLSGAAGADTLTGGSGDDELDGGTGNDSIRAGDGDDEVNGGVGNDTLSGGNGDDQLNGGTGADTISGNAGADTLDGGEGNDSIRGNNGADLILWSVGDGSDTINGGNGADTLQVTAQDGGSGITVVTIAASGSSLDVLISAPALGTTSTLTASSVEEILVVADDNGTAIVTSGDLSSVGVSRNTINFVGGAGDDTVDARAQEDDVRVVADFGDGDDTYIGSAGDDVIEGGLGFDTKIGGDGADTFLESIEDLAEGGAINDFDNEDIIRIVGFTGDIAFGVSGADFTTLELDEDGDGIFDATLTIEGHFEGDNFAELIEIEQEGEDTVITLSDNAIEIPITGGGTATEGDDVIAGSDENDTISGLGGNDILDGNEGDDSVSGDDGSDVVRGEAGNDTLHGGAGNDFVDGNRGDDSLTGGDGDDVVEGELGDDKASGGAGDDIVEGGLGNDTLHGDAGNDLLLGDSGDDSADGGEGSDTVEGGEGDDTLEGGAAGDIMLGEEGDDDLSGGDGNDVLNGGEGADTLTLGDGNDLVRGTVSELQGDTIADFSEGDSIRILNDTVAEVALEFGSADLQIDLDGSGETDLSVTLGSEPTGGEFLITQVGDDAVVSFAQVMPELSDKTMVDPDLINGVTAPYLLENSGDTTFSIVLEDIGFAAASNALGAYDIAEDGTISNVRMLIDDANAQKGETFEVTDVQQDHRLSFFIVRDGADWASGLADTSVLEFVDADGDAANVRAGAAPMLMVDGEEQSETIFHSSSPDLNADGLVHSLSGLAADGESLTVGFEDIFNGGDKDYEDVVFTVSRLLPDDAMIMS